MERQEHFVGACSLRNVSAFLYIGRSPQQRDEAKRVYSRSGIELAGTDYSVGTDVDTLIKFNRHPDYLNNNKHNQGV